jgi:hypothetical protein
MSELSPDGAVTELATMRPHDHAWRKVRAANDDPALLEGSYRCDLCSAVWSL